MIRSIKESLLYRHLKDFYLEDHLIKMLEAITFRASTFRLTSRGQTTEDDVLQSMIQDLQETNKQTISMVVSQCTWFPRAFGIPGQALTKGQIQRLRAVKHGQVYFQGLASMLPALCLDARPGMKVLDMCAAPGGKTTLIASDPFIMDRRGHLLAVEPDFLRLQRLLHTTKLLLAGEAHQQPDERMGKSIDDGIKRSLHASIQPVSIRNVTVCRTDGRFLRVDSTGMPLSDHCLSDRSFKEDFAAGTPSSQGGPFDRILVDVPCSGSGRVLASDLGAWQSWSVNSLTKQALRQKQLLWNAALLLKSGGSLIYSTCSVSPQENEEVVSWLLEHMHQMSMAELDLAPAILAANVKGPPRVTMTASEIPRSKASGSYITSRLIGVLAGQHRFPLDEINDQSFRLQDQMFEPLQPAPSWSVQPGLSSYRGRDFKKGLSLAVRLLPCSLHEGFFIAKLKKR